MLRAGIAPDALRGHVHCRRRGRRCPRRSTSAGRQRFGIDILDGIGMTEMLHIFLSNRPGQVRPGTTGVAVPGYDLRLLDEAPAPR